MPQGCVTVLAGAKVNPVLAVHGRRADGYHELSGVMLGLDLFDEVAVAAAARARAPITVASRGPFASADIAGDETNLAARGARAALEVLGRCDVPLHIELHKAVPSRAGLGGGSSDAAAAALATLELLHPGWTAAQGTAVIERLGRIGADCAFFFAARSHGAARSSGRGEVVEPVGAAPPWYVALLTPAIHCATPAVYGALGLELSPPAQLRAAALRAEAERLAESFFSASAGDARALLRNDLEAPAVRAFPGLAEWRSLFQELGHGHFLLAGSGSSFFGLFDTSEDAAAALASLRAGAAARALGLRYTGVHRPAGARLLSLTESPDHP